MGFNIPGKQIWNDGLDFDAHSLWHLEVFDVAGTLPKTF
jgi:hypothetical protein